MYVSYKEKRQLVIFFVTAVTNSIIAILITIFFLKDPSTSIINLKFILWIFSGVLMVVLLGMKILIFSKIYHRTKKTEYYKINFFGKKVYTNNIVKNKEYFFLMVSTPFFLMSGAFFVARLARLFIKGHL